MADKIDEAISAEYRKFFGVAWNAARAIAPGRELELAEALPEIIEYLRYMARMTVEHRHSRAAAILAKLGLNGGENG